MYSSIIIDHPTLYRKQDLRTHLLCVCVTTCTMLFYDVFVTNYVRKLLIIYISCQYIRLAILTIEGKHYSYLVAGLTVGEKFSIGLEYMYMPSLSKDWVL